MAGDESIEAAGDALELSVDELVTLLKAFREFGDEVGGPCSSAGWPSWLSVMEARAHDIEERATRYRSLVYRHTQPIRVDCPFAPLS